VRSMPQILQNHYVLAVHNARRSVVYFLLFPSPNATGNKIVDLIFNKYRNYRG